MARTDLRLIAEMAQLFRHREGRWPTVADLTKPDRRGNVMYEGGFNDPWGHEYVLRLVDDGNSRVLSLGPDGVLGTADDLTWPVR